MRQDFTAEEKGSSWKGERDGNPDIEEAVADGALLVHEQSQVQVQVANVSSTANHGAWSGY